MHREAKKGEVAADAACEEDWRALVQHCPSQEQGLIEAAQVAEQLARITAKEVPTRAQCLFFRGVRIHDEDELLRNVVKAACAKEIAGNVEEIAWNGLGLDRLEWGGGGHLIAHEMLL